MWFAEADNDAAFPLDDRSALEIVGTPRSQLASPRSRYAYFLDTTEVPEAQAVNISNRSYTIGALVDVPAPPLRACCSRTGRGSAGTPSTSRTTASTTSSASLSSRSIGQKTFPSART